MGRQQPSRALYFPIARKGCDYVRSVAFVARSIAPAVITGKDKDDALVSWENSRIIAERIAGAELVLLEPAGHCFWLEQPKQSREAISRFIHAHPVSESQR